MDDSKFDELFSDKLGEEQVFDFREEDWEEVADRLENKPKRRMGWLWIAAGLLIGFSLVLNAWQASQLRTVQHEISILQERIDQQTPSKEVVVTPSKKINSNLKQGDENQSTIIYKTDTIYQTVYKTIIQEKEVPVYIYPQEANQLKGEENSIPDAPEDLNQGDSSNDKTPNIPMSPKTGTAKWTGLDLLTPPPLLPLLERDQLLDFSPLHDIPENSSADRILKPAFKKQWILGPSVAYSRVPNGDCKEQKNLHLGVDLDVQLSKRWTLESNFSYNRLQNICKIPADLDSNSIFLVGTNQVVNTPSGVGYEISQISNIKSDQSYLQIALGAKHHFSKNFYLGGHVLGYYLLKRSVSINAQYSNRAQDKLELESPNQEVIQEENIEGLSVKYPTNFFNRNDDQAFFPEPDVNGTSGRNRPGLLLNRIELTAGKEFRIKDRLRVPVELFYQTNLNKTSFSLPSLVGLRASFQFQL